MGEKGPRPPQIEPQILRECDGFKLGDEVKFRRRGGQLVENCTIENLYIPAEGDHSGEPMAYLNKGDMYRHITLAELKRENPDKAEQKDKEKELLDFVEQEKNNGLEGLVRIVKKIKEINPASPPKEINNQALIFLTSFTIIVQHETSKVPLDFQIAKQSYHGATNYVIAASPSGANPAYYQDAYNFLQKINEEKQPAA